MREKLREYRKALRKLYPDATFTIKRKGILVERKDKKLLLENFLFAHGNSINIIANIMVQWTATNDN